MNDKFFKLDEQKQHRIINAALKVFSLHDYKHANTNDIVAAANISKGLLFHYFGSKKNLYLYLYDYSLSLVKQQMQSHLIMNETDFFELIINAQNIKTSIMRSYPYIFTFMLKAYYEQDNEVASDIAAHNLQTIDANIALILQHADRSKFRADVSLEQALNLVIWCSEGFMRSKLQQETIDIEAIHQEFLQYLQLLKQSLYKSE